MKKTTDDIIYSACWITCGLLLAVFCLWWFLLDQPALTRCWFYTKWHIYCPGCGGTRAMEAMLRGRLLVSLYYHPAVLFTACSVFGYLASQTIWRLRGRQGFVIHYSDYWLWTLFGLFALHCIVRNLLWFGFGMAL